MFTNCLHKETVFGSNSPFKLARVEDYGPVWEDSLMFKVSAPLVAGPVSYCEIVYNFL